MKVCTDSCLFGAWVARHIKNAARVLDIGSGTGLLALMYAQQNPSSVIDAIEIDPAAAKQAGDNCKASPWADRINLYPTAIQQFESAHKYDLVIANPPFFEKDLRSPHTGRNDAMHDTSLTLEKLSSIVPQQLSANGQFAVLLPYHRSDYFITLMNNQGLQLSARLSIKQSLQHDYFRSVLIFTKQPVEMIQEEVINIKGDGDAYSEAFSSLLKEYYLYL